MANNKHTYGFQLYRTLGGGGSPTIIERTIASAYDSQDDGSNNVYLSFGDPLKAVDGGYAALALTTERAEWIAAGFSYIDPTTGRRIKSNTWPNGVTWTNYSDRSIVYCMRAKEALWAIDIDTNDGPTTEVGYLDLVGKNAVHLVAGAVVNGKRLADPRLDIGSEAATAGLGWRIVEVNTKVGQDFTGTNVSLIVQVNDSTEAGSPATNVTAV